MTCNVYDWLLRIVSRFGVYLSIIIFGHVTTSSDADWLLQILFLTLLVSNFSKEILSLPVTFLVQALDSGTPFLLHKRRSKQFVYVFFFEMSHQRLQSVPVLSCSTQMLSPQAASMKTDIF